MLPMLLRLRVRSKEASFGFFLPMILIYILLLPIVIICLVAYGFMLLSPSQTLQARGYLKILFHAPKLLAAARGTEIEVHSDDADVKMFLK